jgi:hypothetical protein
VSNKHDAVGVRDTEGSVSICASADPGGGYHTLCGRSLSDDQFVEVEIADGARINCSSCKCIWREAKRFKASDFTRG